MKARSPGQTAISISIPEELLAQIDRRAESLGLPRSLYIALLAKQDLIELGDIILRSPAAKQPTQVELTDEAHQFLIAAIPQLLEYERDILSGNPPKDLPPQPTAVTTAGLWERFLEERRSILENKWYRSKEAGADIGIERAIRDWLQKYSDSWAKGSGAGK